MSTRHRGYDHAPVATGLAQLPVVFGGTVKIGDEPAGFAEIVRDRLDRISFTAEELIDVLEDGA